MPYAGQSSRSDAGPLTLKGDSDSCLNVGRQLCTYPASTILHATKPTCSSVSDTYPNHHLNSALPLQLSRKDAVDP